MYKKKIEGDKETDNSGRNEEIGIEEERKDLDEMQH